MRIVPSDSPIRPPAVGLTPKALLTRLGSAAVFVVLLLVVPSFTTDESLRLVIPPFLALIYFQLAPLFWANKPDLFEPVVYTGLFAAMTTISTLSYFMRRGGIHIGLIGGLAPDELADLASSVLWAMSLGLVSYYAGYYHPSWGRRISRVFPRYAGKEWDPGKLKVAAIAVGILYVLAYSAFQLKLNVPLFDMTKLKAGKAVWREDPTLSWMIRGAELGSIPVMFYLAQSLKTKHKRMFLWAAALVVVGGLNVRLGQRGFLLNGILAGMVLFHYLRRRIPTWVFVAGFLVAAVSNQIMLSWRTGNEPQREVELSDAARRPGEVLADHEGDRQRFAALAVLFKEFPENHDYLLGESWLAIAATPIPRWLWPSKNQHFLWRDSAVLMRLVGAPIPITFLGLLYINFSWFGIVLGMLLWGAFHRGVYEWLRQDSTDPSRVLYYTMMVLFFNPTMMGVSAALQFVVPVWFILRYVTRARSATADAAA